MRTTRVRCTCICGLHIFCITLLRSQVCICCILPGSMRNIEDQRRNISTRLVAVCPVGNTFLDAARTSVPGMCSTCFRRTTKTSVFQDAFTLLEYTLTHMRTMRCLTVLPETLLHPHSAQPSVTFLFRSASFASGPSLHAVARPSSPSSLSVSTCWSATDAHNSLSKARSCLCTCGHSLTPLPSLLYCFLC